MRLRIDFFKRFIGCIAFIGLAGGCAQLHDYVEMARPRTLSIEYREALDGWTRERTVYSEFSTRAKIVATFKSPEFMEAWLAEYRRVYLVESDEKGKTHPALESAKDMAEFLLYVYVPDREAIDLDKPDSAWNVILVDAKGDRYQPLEIRELRDVGPMITEFYPYANPYYGKIYLLKFDGAALGGEPTKLPVKLVVTGVVAQVELTW